jgi:hypothetical protein
MAERLRCSAPKDMFFRCHSTTIILQLRCFITNKQVRSTTIFVDILLSKRSQVQSTGILNYQTIEAPRSQLRGTGTTWSSAQLIFDPQQGIFYFLLANSTASSRGTEPPQVVNSSEPMCSRGFKNKFTLIEGFRRDFIKVRKTGK